LLTNKKLVEVPRSFDKKILSKVLGRFSVPRVDGKKINVNNKLTLSYFCDKYY
jgi:hypothetical protein